MTEGHLSQRPLHKPIFYRLDIVGRKTETFFVMAAVSDRAEIHLYLH
jgi:hypothetical protein